MTQKVKQLFYELTQILNTFYLNFIVVAYSV